MKDNSNTTVAVSDRALEMIMRDVLDGLFELSLESSFSAHSDDFEILDIRPEGAECKRTQQVGNENLNAEIIDFPNLKRACG